MTNKIFIVAGNRNEFNEYIREEYKRDYDIEWREDLTNKIRNHFE
jgi:hypothetical protein